MQVLGQLNIKCLGPGWDRLRDDARYGCHFIRQGRAEAALTVQQVIAAIVLCNDAQRRHNPLLADADDQFIQCFLIDLLARLGLELHPDKTRRVDLSWGKEGFDFLGCHLRKRMSGPIWVRSRKRVYFLQRWPSTRSMTRVRQRVKQMTGSNRDGVKDVRVLIRDINPVLRGWGSYFRTGNAAVKFRQIDDYVRQRLRGFLVRRKGRNLRAGEASRWTHDFFHSHGLHRLRGTIKYPEAA